MRALRAQLAGDTDEAEQLGHRSAPHRHRQRPTRRRLFYGAQLGREPPTRDRRRAGPAHRADGRRRCPSSPAWSPRRWRWPTSKRADIDDARRLLEQFAAAGFELPPDPELAQHDDPLRRRRRRVPRPEVRRAAVRPARAVRRSVAHDGGIDASARSATTWAASPPSSAATTRPTPTSPRPPRSTTEPTPSSSPPAPTSPGAKMLAERDAPGDIERARDLLTKAHAAAAAHGYANVERRAAEALQHLD